MPAVRKAKPSPSPSDVVRSTRLSPTERRNPRSLNLDKLPVREAVTLMLSEEARVPRILLRHHQELNRAVGLVAGAFRRGGRLVYVGAGTSGRLGVLDASECPPTFRAPPEMVQGIMAGGDIALRRSVEGAEDDDAAGAKEIAVRQIGSKDVVLGIAASGTTPFVWGALREAKRRRATTILLCFNPFLAIPRALRPRLMIAPNLGPEVLTGSTRLKAGTATKLVLNLITTLAMVRLGKVKSNLMVDVVPSNAKLRNRAVRIVQQLTNRNYEQAEADLSRSDWNIQRAVRKSVPPPTARGT